MKEVTLQLRPATTAVHPAVAWFIPGADPADWLAEIERFDLPASSLQLYVLPSSPADVTPAGVLVVPPDGRTPARAVRALPYGRLSRRLFLPIDAMPFPPMSDLELTAMLRHPVQVLHPAIGLIGFDAADVHRVEGLLSPPAMADTGWGHAMAGESTALRVRAVEPLLPPQFADVLERGRGDIGSEPAADLPRTPDESPLRDAMKKSVANPAVQAAKAAIQPLRLLAWLSERLGRRRQEEQPPQRPGTAKPAGAGTGPMLGGSGFASTTGGAAASAGPPGWVRRVYENLVGRLDAISRNLLDQRQQSLERLQKMLADDPDEGLRHAISLRHVEGRGVSSPSAGLPTRDIAFSLPSALGGSGGPVDAWDIPADTVYALRQQYREAANRELRLGRYQRAAYIFAELLGDYSAAAAALEQGRFFREAAVLYREKLANPHRAATCLQSGGLLVEAAAAWVELSDFERAGDLYLQIDQPDEAANCYRRAVAALIAKPDLLAAARLLEKRLEAADEALALLSSAWPGERAAAACLVATFELLDRLGRHEESSRRLTSLRREPTPPSLAAALVEVLGGVAASYTTVDIRRHAADAARVVASRTLSALDPPAVRRITLAVAKLAPHDLLLSRDATRLADRMTTSTPEPRIRQVVVLRQFHLPTGVRWAAASRFDGGYCALGWTRESVAMIVGERWTGGWAATQRQQVGPHPVWPQLTHVPGHDLILTPSALDSGAAVRLDWYSGTGDNTTKTYSLFVQRPSWLSGEMIAVNERGVVWDLSSGDGQVEPFLSAFNSVDGQLLSSHSMPGVSFGQTRCQAMIAVRDEVYLAWGSAVVCFIPIMTTRVDETPRPVTGLIASHGRRDRRVVATMEEGCLLLDPTGVHRSFAPDLSEPVATFLRSDKIVVIDSTRGRVYGLKDRREPTLLHTFSVAGRPIAVIAADQVDQFATFNAEGIVTVYQAPA